jgi:O-antigen ligase/Flp pilus assembly protein TadD
MATRFYPPPLILAELSVRRPLFERVARLLGGVIFYALLALIPLTAIPYGTVEEWWNSLFQCIVFVMAGLWVIEGLLSDGWLVREHRLLAPLIPLFAFIFFQSVPLGKVEAGGTQVWHTLSADAYETRLAAFRFLALILVAAMLLRYTSTQRRLRVLVYVVIYAAVASAMFGIVRQVAHHDGEGFVLPYLQPQVGYGQFIATNHFTFLMEMALGLVLGLMAWRDERKQRFRLFCYLAVGVLILSALVLSNSRGGILGLFGEILFFALLFRALRASGGGMWGQPPASPSRFANYVLLRRPAQVMCLLVVIGVGIVWVGADPLVRWMENSQTEAEAGGAGNGMCPSRIEMWQATWEMIKNHPFFGTGFGGYWLAIDSYFDASGGCVPQQAHNDYLEIISSGGLVAVALMAWFVVAFVKRARKCLRRARRAFRRAACLGALTGLCAAAIHSFVDFGLHITVNALVFTSLVVIATAHVGSHEHGREVDEARQPSLPDSVLPTLEQHRARALQHKVIRFAVAVVSLLVCMVVIRETAHAGLSRWYSMSREREYSLASAEEAVRLSPSDPAALFFHASMLSLKSGNRESLEELKRAVALRPWDHIFWTNLGFAREREDDLTGAVAAFQEAVRLAPYYPNPRWQLGNALLRAGQHERAFVELSHAVASDPELLPQMLDLLWDALDADAAAIIKAISPQSPATQLALARFFKKHDEMTEAIALLRQAGSVADAERREWTAEMISEKRFEKAYELWSSGRADRRVKGNDRSGIITDGNFEGDVDLTEPGFGWQATSNKQGLLVSLDTKEPRAGSRSLRLDFKGEVTDKSPLISQLVFVKANARYQLSFAARTQELMTAGTPVVALIDASSGQALGQSKPLNHGSSGWQDEQVEFVTHKTTSVLMITVQRQKCTMRPCLIFGRVWLDSFSLQQL